ncbi:hypothetical protein AGMMS49921_08300 [Endomicrobiia bacterium]|nr:hypothetical protein AGMMS49921_08300 [Endomicrobiia bacterium]
MNFSSYTNTALAAANAGSEVLAKYYNNILDIDYKGKSTLLPG